MPLFLTCKQVSKELSREDYEKLSPLGKLSLKLHVILCPICGAYNRQVMKFHDLMRRYRSRKERELEQEDAPRLEEEARERLRNALRNASRDEDT